MSRGWMISTAESCTGGGLGFAFTDVPGSSKWYLGGVVSYSNSLKTKFLGVPENLIEEFGAVSEPVVIAMAAGLVAKTDADAAIAVSGIAGPSGGTITKPVGLIWLGTKDPDRGLRSLKLNLSGSRDAVRRRAIEGAINFFLEDL